MEYPEVTRRYENHHLDGPRWERFETRPNDIVITTAYKSGTTWTQTIVANLLFQDGNIPGAIMDISPWVDMRVVPFPAIQEATANQTFRRFLKTHLPLDGLPYKPELSYIYVGRDLRDVFMSLWNHYSGHSDTFYELMNDPDTLVGEPLPRCGDDIKEMWKHWVSRGWFDWEHDGYPHFSATHHAQSWWDYRHLPNILFLHYGDLLRQPSVEIQRVADFLEIPVSSENLARVVEATTFKPMKADGDNIVGQAGVMWNGGAQRFLHKGTNGRWHEVLNDKDLEAYEAMKNKTLSRECAGWLEQGRAALTGAANE